MRYIYPAVFKRNELGGYDVSFVDFKDLVTLGDDLQDAVEMAAEALELKIEAEIESGHDLPDPTYQEKQTMKMSSSDKLIVKEEPLYICVDVDVDRLLVSTKQAAEMLHISHARVRQLILAGKLASKQQGRDNFVYLWSIRERLNSPKHPGRPKGAMEA